MKKITWAMVWIIVEYILLATGLVSAMMWKLDVPLFLLPDVTFIVLVAGFIVKVVSYADLHFVVSSVKNCDTRKQETIKGLLFLGIVATCIVIIGVFIMNPIYMGSEYFGFSATTKWSFLTYIYSLATVIGILAIYDLFMVARSLFFWSAAKTLQKHTTVVAEDSAGLEIL